MFSTLERPDIWPSMNCWRVWTLAPGNPRSAAVQRGRGWRRVSPPRIFTMLKMFCGWG